MAEIDKRTKQDILTALRERAASYTPEWHFDEKEPDIAAVLAMAYADMAAGTIKKLNGIPLKNKIAYFDRDDVRLPKGRFFFADIIGAKVVDEEGEDLLVPIEDDDVFESIAAIFEERLADYYEINEVDETDTPVS